MPGSGGYQLHCTVCGDSFPNRTKWVNHLTQLSHQRIATSQCHQWAETEMGCAVIVFATSEEVVLDVPTFFTKGNTIVTNFILNKIRPRVAIMQFESSDKVTEELSKLKSSGTKINKHTVQLKRATECLLLEWQEFLPNFNHQKVKVADVVNFNTSNHMHAKVDQFSATASRISSMFEKNKLKGTLLQKFNSICNGVLINKHDFDNALSIVEKLKNMFQPNFPNTNCEVYMFRHWYLGLNSIGTNELLIFGYTQALSKLHGDVPTGSHNTHLKILSYPDFTDNPLILTQTKLPPISIEEVNNGHSYAHIPTGLKFRFISNILLLPEVQTCRMVTYLCKFDNRVLPLLTLVNYWAKTNLVEFSSLKITDLSFPHLAPEPAALEWLVMFFLMRRRIVPCIREIMKLPHSIINFSRFNNKIDIGFEPDAKFCKDWMCQNNQKVNCNSDSDEFVIHILQLIREFFAFYSIDNYFRNYVLNVIDGEIIHKSKLINTLPENEHVTNLTPKELMVLKSNLHRSPLTLVHPLSTFFYLGFLPNKFINVTRPMMSETVHKLNDCLVGIEKSTDGIDLLNLDLKSLFQCEPLGSESNTSRKRKRSESC